MMIEEKMLTLASDAARQAGIYALERFGRVEARFKAGEQVVTDADRQCQAAIIAAVRKAFPQHGFLAEENEDPSQNLLKIAPTDDEQTWWVIDPIDGTRNYANKVPLFTVSVGILRRGMPVLGVIYDPVRDELFSGGPGIPSRRNGCAISCRDEKIGRNSQIAIQGHFDAQPPAGLMNLFIHSVCSNLGTAALHYAYVAGGAYTAALGWDIRLWDIVAGAAIAIGAGATVTDLRGEPRFPFDCRNYSGGPVPIAMAGRLAHPQLMKILQGKSLPA